MQNKHKTLLLTTQNGYYAMANFSLTQNSTLLSFSCATIGEKKVKVWCNDKEWEFNAYTQKAEFFLPLIDLEKVGIAVFVGDSLVCKNGKEKEIEKFESYENDKSEESKTKEKEEVEIEQVYYNDNQVMQENYYPPTYKIHCEKDKEQVIYLSSKIYEYAENNQDGLFNCLLKSKQNNENSLSSMAESEVASTQLLGKSTFRRTACYYEQVKDKIDDLFEKGERQTDLENLMGDSKWVKINNNKNQYYVVGIIGSKNSIPDYICYGVPSSFSFLPPASLGKDARWLPIDVKSPQGKGFWVIFQSARTGETIKTE